MKLLQANAGLLTNSEVLQVLRERGASDATPEGPALASERQVFKYVHEHSAGDVSSARLQGFVEAVKALGLTRAEILQLINLRPASAVEVHLVVEACEKRLEEGQVEDLLALVQQHLA